MKRDYKSDLEKAARQMILVRRVDTLIRLILRTIMRSIRVNHAGIFLYDKERDEYIVKVSKGKKGIKVPAGFAKVKKDNPLIRYFTDKEYKQFDQDFLLYNKINYYLKYSKVKGSTDLVNFLKNLRNQLTLFEAKACLPGFFRDTMVGLLFLGSKLDKTRFRAEELGFLSVLASDVVMAIQNAWLFEDLNKQLEVNKRLFLSTITALATAIEAKDKYTLGHTERVVRYSLVITDYLKNVKINNREKFKGNLRTAALLHDIGKIGIPEKVLNKKNKLTRKEKKYIHNHPLVGIEILNHIKELKDVILGVKYHHERYDGKGYPFKLKGNRIPVIASIISVADAFDAMVTDRPYRKAFSREVAVKEIKKNRKKQFSPCIVDAFLKAYKNKEI